MFGYIRPMIETLEAEEKLQYQAAYCGLCHEIGRRYGFVAQLFLSYDFAFLAMILAQNKQTPCVACKRCRANPFRKKETWQKDEGLTLCADESIILTYWKLKDGVADEKGIKKVVPWLAQLALYPSYKKAWKYRPLFAQKVQECLQQLSEIENENSPSIDRAADAFANIVRAASAVDGEAGNEALGQTLYHIGRWLYLIDAWDDLEEDRKNGTYNPILLRYNSNLDAAQSELEETLYTSLGIAVNAYAWVDCGVWHSVISNVITLGLPAVQEAVLAGEWKKKTNHKEIWE